MKKLIVCSLPLQVREPKKYPSLDKSLEMPDKEIVFPVCGLIEKTIKPEDDLTIVLIERPGKIDCTKENSEIFKSEFAEANKNACAKYHFIELKADFKETRRVTSFSGTDNDLSGTIKGYVYHIKGEEGKAAIIQIHETISTYRK